MRTSRCLPGARCVAAVVAASARGSHWTGARPATTTGDAHAPPSGAESSPGAPRCHTSLHAPALFWHYVLGPLPSGRIIRGLLALFVGWQVQQSRRERAALYSSPRDACMRHMPITSTEMVEQAPPRQRHRAAQRSTARRPSIELPNISWDVFSDSRRIPPGL